MMPPACIILSILTCLSPPERQVQEHTGGSSLIEYMKQTYPIDETRVYCSGFSNGSAMVQVFAMVHPEIVAAVCP